MAINLQYPLGNYSVDNPPSNETLKGDLATLQVTVNAQEDQINNLDVDPSAVIHAAPAKTTPVDADEFGIVNSQASNILSKLTWANIKATLKTYFDTLYSPLAGSSSITTVGTVSTGTVATRVNPRTNTVASSATPSINTDTTDVFTITALATAITSMTSGLSGTPVNGQKLIIRILDNGTARAITWGTSFVSRGATLPTTTVASKYTYVGLIYNSTASKWDCVSVAQEV